jgi:transposase
MATLQAHDEGHSAAVGIDVSKDWLDVHALPSGRALRVDLRQDPSMKALLDFIASLEGTVDRVVLEATGGYEACAVAVLADAGLPVVVANPAHVRSFARALGQLAKTDAADARVIALYAQRIRPEIRPLADGRQRELRETMARRRQLLGMVVMENNRSEKTACPRVKASVERVLEALHGELEELRVQLDALVLRCPEWQEREDLLRTVPGVGPVVARTLVAHMPELGTLDRGKIAALAGLAPVARDSGKKRGQRSIWGGRAAVRSALYMAAVTAVRCNAPIKAMYKRLLDAGKPGKLAIVACARKLLTILNAMVRHHKTWSTALT